MPEKRVKKAKAKANAKKGKASPKASAPKASKAKATPKKAKKKAAKKPAKARARASTAVHSAGALASIAPPARRGSAYDDDDHRNVSRRDEIDGFSRALSDPPGRLPDDGQS